MKRYKGAENAGVASYGFTKDGIILQFKDGRSYLYSTRNPGKTHVEEMKRLAVAGEGLTTYVNQHIRENYEARLS